MSDEQFPLGAVVKVLPDKIESDAPAGIHGLKAGMVGVVTGRYNKELLVVQFFNATNPDRERGVFYMTYDSVERIDTQHTTEE